MESIVQNFIDGTWVDSRSGKHFEKTNPADSRDVVASVTISDRGDVDLAVAAARRAYPAWKALPAPKRGEILFRVGEMLLKKKTELGHLVTREMGKVLAEGLGDVQEAIDMAYYMAGEGRRLHGETVPSELTDKDCKSVREPHGVIALITPWNFPTAIPAWKLFPALICGNTVVLKPSSSTPACAAALVQALEEAGVPKGVVNLFSDRVKMLGNTWLPIPGSMRFPLPVPVRPVNVSKRCLAHCTGLLLWKWEAKMPLSLWMMPIFTWPWKGSSGEPSGPAVSAALPQAGFLCMIHFTSNFLSY